ncbi:glycosyltransferase family 2 protein [Ferruginibacter lapsinanis]|uniref:glycosyltransferase family 2 protein n=1 Tax=Ferruginibacter lapsinanis TaxID=563172 RepID=UPI001E32848A|nr:glycosyltransferase family A protein [Ferruginibacter lapsinanis]UEG49455.1 glycosyltransferase family 2 protein [Ferruginibacter lapsinanis]
MSSLVSIIIPCYNAAAYIGQTLESILSQTYTDLEVIVINDGSKDDSEKIIQSFSDKRIKYFSIPNQGQCKASNFGLSKATGEYIKFFDADDLMNDTHIELQLKKLDGRIDAMASCEWGRFYDGNPQSAVFTAESVWKDMSSLEWLKSSLSQKYDMMGAWVWLIPKKVLDKTGGWDERLSLNNDFEFSIRLLTNVNDVLFAEGAKAFYRSGISGSISASLSEQAYKNAILSTDLGCTYLLNKENSVLTRSLCADRYNIWLHRMYPDHPLLCTYLENKIKELGGSNRQIEGGRFFILLSKIVGWKFAKKLKLQLSRIGIKNPFK